MPERQDTLNYDLLIKNAPQENTYDCIGGDCFEIPVN